MAELISFIIFNKCKRLKVTRICQLIDIQHSMIGVLDYMTNYSRSNKSCSASHENSHTPSSISYSILNFRDSNICSIPTYPCQNGFTYYFLFRLSIDVFLISSTLLGHSLLEHEDVALIQHTSCSCNLDSSVFKI